MYVPVNKGSEPKVPKVGGMKRGGVWRAYHTMIINVNWLGETKMGCFRCCRDSMEGADIQDTYKSQRH